MHTCESNSMLPVNVTAASLTLLWLCNTQFVLSILQIQAIINPWSDTMSIALFVWLLCFLFVCCLTCIDSCLELHWWKNRDWERLLWLRKNVNRLDLLQSWHIRSTRDPVGAIHYIDAWMVILMNLVHFVKPRFVILEMHSRVTFYMMHCWCPFLEPFALFYESEDQWSKP